MTEQTYRATDKGNMYIRLSQIEDIKTRLNNPQTRLKALADTAEWIKETGLFFGASPVTAYKTAAVFIEGLENDYE